MACDIFISYSGQDQLKVKPLAEALIEYGWRVWWMSDMRISSLIDNEVNEHLRNARAVIAICSANSSESRWFFGETEYALNRKTPLFPVLIDRVEIPPRLLGVHAIELLDWSERSTSPNFNKLVIHLEKTLGFPESHKPTGEASKISNFDSPLDELNRKKEQQKSGPGDAITGEGRPAGGNPESGFIDPTIEFPRSSASGAYAFPRESIGNWDQRLLSGRLIGVRSPNDDITSAAVDALLNLDEFTVYETRLLAFGPENQERTDLILESMIRHRVGKPNAATIVVVDPHGALPFINSILSGPHKAKAIATELKFRDLVFVVQIGSRYWRELRPRFDTFRFECWHVDWLEPLIRRYFSEGDLPDILKRLRQQRQNKLWGEPGDDLAFYEMLQAALATGTTGLKQALDQRDSEGSNRQKPHLALAGFREGPEHCRALLFCATFFPGLDVHEFKKVCFALAGDVRDSSGDGRQTSTLREQWFSVSDEVFRTCGLIVGRPPGPRTIMFSEPEARAALTALADNYPNYCLYAGEKLWETGLMFRRESSPELVEGMIGVLTRLMDHDNTLRQRQWLSTLLSRKLSESLPQNLRELLQAADANELVLSRASQLLRSLLADAERAALVKTWLADLLAQREHYQCLRLATHLRHTKGFDYLYWLKRLFDEGPEDVHVAAYLALFRHALQSSSEIWEFFEALKAWMPKRSKAPVQEMSRSNIDALRIVIDYSFAAANELTRHDIGNWPSRYSLFRDLALSSDWAANNLEAFIESLFYPALAVLFLGLSDDPEGSAWVTRGRLIVVWCHVLLGLDESLTHPDAKAAYHRILSLCWKNANPAGRIRLLDVWQAEKSIYEQSHAHVRNEARRELTLRIGLIDRLDQDFRQFAADASSTDSRSSSGNWNNAQL